MEILKIKRRVHLKKPYLVVAWPGMGDVAFKAANYLVEHLKAEELASIEAEGFFYLTGSVIASGILEKPRLPESKFYFWRNKAGKNDLIIFLSNAQPDLSKAEENDIPLLIIVVDIFDSVFPVVPNPFRERSIVEGNPPERMSRNNLKSQYPERSSDIS